MTPAVGAGGGPASWEPAEAGGEVALHVGEWRDGRWSYLYGGEGGYAAERADAGAVADAARRARAGDTPDVVAGPVLKAPVWTWEVPLYFWLGGIAAGASFVAAACDLSGDRRSAALARKVSLAALAPAPALLVMDLGRPARFLNMLRIFKPRSPMSTGVWCLSAFGALGAGAVAADLAGRSRAARALGAANAGVGVYLGSYAGVLLAATAVPVWARSRLLLGPIFVASATGTGAAATRLALAAAGPGAGRPARAALARVEVGAMAAKRPARAALARVEVGAMVVELALSALNERRLGPLASALDEGRPGRLMRAAKWGGRTGLALSAASRAGARGRRAPRGIVGAPRGPLRARHARRRLFRAPSLEHLASGVFLAAGLALRYGWVEAGKASARDDEAVARNARRPRVSR